MPKRLAFPSIIHTITKVHIGWIAKHFTMPGRKDMVVIWPLYFDAARSRRDGRMVPASSTVSSPTLDQLITAAIKAGYKPEIERDKKHPSNWYETSGRILVPKSGPKSAILRKIAAGMRSKK